MRRIKQQVFLDLAEVAEESARLTGCPAPHPATVSRWGTVGIRVGDRVVRLARTRIGGRVYVERSAVRDFLEAINQQVSA